MRQRKRKKNLESLTDRQRERERGVGKRESKEGKLTEVKKEEK